MLHFTAIESGSGRNGAYTYRVYRSKYNRLCYIGEGYINYKATRGEYDEVMNWLSINGHIAKKFKGYYQDHDNKNFCIDYIVPINQK